MPAGVRGRIRTFVVAALALASGVLAAQAPTQTPPSKGTGFLLGQVIDAGTGRPIPAANVTLSGGAVITTQLSTGEIVTSNVLPAGTPGATPSAPRQIIADSSGRFLFRELSQGTYSIRVAAPGYIAGVYGQNRPGGSSQSIVLERDDEKRAGIVIRMWQAGSISGRIVDEIGEPIVGASPRLFRKTTAGGRVRLTTAVSGVSTDDRGIYRFNGVTPGDYLVAILSTATTLPAAAADAYMQGISSSGPDISNSVMSDYQSSGAPLPFASGFRIGDLIFQTDGQLGRGGSTAIPPPLEDGRVLAYPTVFYPSAGNPSQATVITIGSGEDRTSIDFQLRLRRTVNVSGTVTGPEGPVKNVGLKLLPQGVDEYSSISGIEVALTAADASGAFTFLGVPPGTYLLQCIRVPRAPLPRGAGPTTSVEVMGPNGLTMMGMSSGGPIVGPALPLPTDPTLWAGMTITVGESDVHNLAVQLRQGSKIGGHIVFEGAGEKPPPEVLQRTSISIQSMGGAMPIQVTGAQKRVETDGSFMTVGYPPGRFTLTATMPPAPARAGGAGWRFKTATLGGRDLSDEGFEIQGNDISGIVITFTDRPTEVSGTVVDVKGQPDATAMVVVIPADSTAWRNAVVSPRRVRGVRTTTVGAFTITDLPPGEYFIAAVSDASMDNWQDPRNLEAITRVASRITLADATKLSQQLKTVTVK